MISRHLKNGILSTAATFGVDRWFRNVNRKKLLVVMYHGITALRHDPPVWTQLPAEKFRSQLEFLCRHYTLISQGELVAAIHNGTSLPERAAMITFDDGLRNNFSVALPILRELGAPATVFLTVDLVGSKEILWVDELYLLLRQAAEQGISPELRNWAACEHFRAGRVWQAYEITVEDLKRSCMAERTSELNRLRNNNPVAPDKRRKDFELLTWEEVKAMYRTGLVEFGVHTATHRIVSELDEGEWEREIVAPRKKLEENVGPGIASFCFPNGRPNVDFRPEHLDLLKKAGYACAFTTESALFAWPGGNCMSIGRVPAGNDGTSDSVTFRLNTSGALRFAKELLAATGVKG